MAVFFACFGLLEAVCGGGWWAAEAVTWGWEGPSLILLNADGEGKLVSLLKLTELSLPIDLTQKLRLFKNDPHFQKNWGWEKLVNFGVNFILKGKTPTD